DANRELRADPSLRDTNHDTEPWPLRYLIVGSDGGGDDWCVDMSDEREGIWIFDSEAHGTFRHASPATWAEYLAAPRSPKAGEPLPVRHFLCKRGALAPEAAGDGSFALTDTKGRDWVCFETKEPTPEEILARVRGEVRTPTWLGEKGLKSLVCASVEE